MDRNRKIGMGMVLLGASLWGSSSNCMEYLMTHQHFTWQAILFARMVLTGLFFLAFCLYKKEPLLAPLRKDPWLMLKFTVLGMFVMQVPFVKAIYYSNAATATVLQYLMPAILLVMSLWKAKRGPRRREVVAVGLAILGTALIATRGQGAALAVSPETLFWGILGAFGMAWYTLYAAELLQCYSCFLIIGWGSLGNALLLELLVHPNVQGAVFNFDTLWSFGVLFVLGTLVAYTVYLESTRYIPASETGTLAAFEPLSAYFFSILFLGNHIGVAESIGALCIITMVVLLARK
ncbi:DMT family transporter [Acidaminococcus timonensis]|uniref:DMT family transporter n=1 Tax=Acidaminococcus timonensis TaxID=1871002 RepID=UPI00248CE30A|nr:DMT family transporter [Acidaminococcus timonensis]